MGMLENILAMLNRAGVIDCLIEGLARFGCGMAGLPDPYVKDKTPLGPL